MISLEQWKKQHEKKPEPLPTIPEPAQQEPKLELPKPTEPEKVQEILADEEIEEEETSLDEQDEQLERELETESEEPEEEPISSINIDTTKPLEFVLFDGGEKISPDLHDTQYYLLLYLLNLKGQSCRKMEKYFWRTKKRIDYHTLSEHILLGKKIYQNLFLVMGLIEEQLQEQGKIMEAGENFIKYNLLKQGTPPQELKEAVERYYSLLELDKLEEKERNRRRKHGK